MFPPTTFKTTLVMTGKPFTFITSTIYHNTHHRHMYHDATCTMILTTGAPASHPPCPVLPRTHLSTVLAVNRVGTHGDIVVLNLHKRPLIPVQEAERVERKLKLGAGADEHAGHHLGLALPRKLQGQHAVRPVHHLKQQGQGQQQAFRGLGVLGV